MPASILSPNEVSEPFNTATLSSPSRSLSTVSCESIKTIEAWLDNVEVTVVVEEVGKAGSELAQKPEAKSTHKRKHSSSLSEEDSSQSFIRKPSQHLPKLALDYAISMAQPTTSNAIDGLQVCHPSPSTYGCVAYRSQAPMTPKTSSASDAPSTPSSKAKISMDSGWIGRRLEMHGLLYDPKALKKYPEFHGMVLDIVDGERYSEMKQRSIERVQHYGYLCDETNEATFLHTILPLILKVDRTVKLEQNKATENSLELAGDGDSVVQDPQPGHVYGSRDWCEDGIFAVVDQDFRKDSLPHCFADEDLARIMKKVDGMTTPRPDRCYGLAANWIRGPQGVQLDAELQALLETCPHLSHPFFLIEGKSNNGSKIDAQNQARRGGASLVNAARQLLNKIGEVPTIANGVDDRNFVFSATIYPGGMGIWVHWAELENGSPWFHMNLLKSLSLDDPQHISDSRSILNNIMCWGCDLDTRHLKELHQKVYAWQIQETARLQEDNRLSKVEKSSRKRPRQQ